MKTILSFLPLAVMLFAITSTAQNAKDISDIGKNTNPTTGSINGPMEIVLKTAQAKKPAYFPHKKHQDKYFCSRCHHSKDSSGRKARYTEKTVIQKCTTCHNSEMPDEKLNDWQAIGHALCRDCHRKNRGITSAKCSTCHRKNL